MANIPLCTLSFSEILLLQQSIQALTMGTDWDLYTTAAEILDMAGVMIMPVHILYIYIHTHSCEVTVHILTACYSHWQKSLYNSSWDYSQPECVIIPLHTNPFFCDHSTYLTALWLLTLTETSVISVQIIYIHTHSCEATIHILTALWLRTLTKISI